MEKLTVLTIALILLGCLNVTAQDVDKSLHSRILHPKTVRISGKLSENAAKLVEDKRQKVWVVKNPDTLKGYEGQKVVLKGRVGADGNEVEVFDIREQVTYTTNWSDSAFRR